MLQPVQDIKDFLATQDETQRKLLLGELFETIAAAETPQETAIRVSLYPLQASAARIGQDLKIFQILDNEGPKSLKELQASTGAHPLTLTRLLRYMASAGQIRQSGEDKYESNAKCHNLANPEATTIVTHFFENCGPLFQEMPAFLRAFKYQDVTDGLDTVFQLAYQTKLDTYSYFAQHPDNLHALINYMGLEQDRRSDWMNQYPLTEYSRGWKADEPVFVDVGGNVGYYCALLKKKHPEIVGRVILQDRSDTLRHAIPTPGVEVVPHDFFTPQPVKGSKFYHYGWILHNWSDEKAKEILRQLKPAMTADSILLINDMILPETSVPPYVSALDLVMLGACGSLERTTQQWKDLLADVGFAIKETIIYDRELFHGVIAATVV